MFEAHMDEYLDEEIEWVKHEFDVICKGWDQEVSFLFRFSVASERSGVFPYINFQIDNDITAYSNCWTYTVLGFT